MGHFYKAIVQSILLYGAETWVIKPETMKKLRTFHRRAARYITHRHIRPLNDGTGEWIYPSSEAVLEDAGLFEIEVYIQRRRDTVFKFVKNRKSIENVWNSRRMWKTVSIFTGGSLLI
jgi:hypothetical protein